MFFYLIILHYSPIQELIQEFFLQLAFIKQNINFIRDTIEITKNKPEIPIRIAVTTVPTVITASINSNISVPITPINIQFPYLQIHLSFLLSDSLLFNIYINDTNSSSANPNAVHNIVGNDKVEAKKKYAIPIIMPPIIPIVKEHIHPHNPLLHIVIPPLF